MTPRTPAALMVGLMAAVVAALAVLSVGCGVSSEDKPQPIGETPTLPSPVTPTSTNPTTPTTSSAGSPAPSSPPPVSSR